MTRRPLALLLAAVAALALLPAAAGADTTAEDVDSRVVVAPIDSGINPYHEVFQVGDATSVTADVLAEFGIGEDQILRISDSYEADVEAGLYEGVQLGTPYWFAGTNIIARSNDFGARPFLPDDEGDTHGTGVSGSVAAGNPEAVIYFLEGSFGESEPHAFAHPAVDIVTTSYGFLTAAPLGNIGGSYEGVVEGGKLHFGANPNDPSLGPLDSTGGPWWGISMSGFAEGEGDGKSVFSGSLPEFVADFTQDLPYCATCTTGTESVSGTSFATPLSAGILSHALLELRRMADHDGGIVDVDGTAYMVHDPADPSLQLTNWDLRRALEEAAVVPSVEEYDPAAMDPVLGEAYPNLPVAGYSLYGWGLLTVEGDRDVRPVIVDHALGAEPTKSADTCAAMTAHFQARLALWAANPSGDGFGVTDTPYEAC